MKNHNRLILNINGTANGILALRAATYLIDHPEKTDALLEYGDTVRMWAKRGKGSVIVWEQPS